MVDAHTININFESLSTWNVISTPWTDMGLQ
jgi:hypothetical protein